MGTTGPAGRNPDSGPPCPLQKGYRKEDFLGP